MTLAAFQHAMADLIGSPDLCVAARREPGSCLLSYDLSDRERRRLLAIVHQRGMSTNCSLYRSNRVTPIYTLLNVSCVLLGEALESELEAYWSSHEFSDLQFQLEIVRFARFLTRRVEQGAIRNPWLIDMLRFELLLNELRFVPRGTAPLGDRLGVDHGREASYRLNPLVRIARFSYDASDLLEALSRGVPHECPGQPGGLFYLLSVLRGDLEMAALETHKGRALYALQNGINLSSEIPDIALLKRTGVVVPVKSSETQSP